MLFKGSFAQLLTVNMATNKISGSTIILCIYFVYEKLKQRECPNSMLPEKLNRAIRKKLK